jgi:hypothetical protein
MIRLLPFVIEAILLVFCLVDAILADESRIRNLPKWAWILLIIVIPLVGGIAWLVAGRPVAATRKQAPWPSRTAGYPEWERPPANLRPRAPDDDPEFLATLKQDNVNHEKLLKQWEDDLRRREEDLRRQHDEGDNPDPAPDER